MMSTFTSDRTWTDADIAALSPGDIAQLNYDEMLELLSSAHQTATRMGAAPVTESTVTESTVLVRHVYALRQRCRNQLSCD